ncbi:MAG: multiple sugar transport system permease protein [Actinomycetota bacterium]|jgi:multiple sugar transport system permease protein|nr:multiple sugar transport system permease protein [Actinomycetota bacterium]
MTLTLTSPPVAAPLRKRRRRQHGTVLLLMGPWILGFLIFFAYPLVATVWYSFTRFDLLSPPSFVGLRNYRYFLFEDPNSWKSLRNTLWFVIFMMPARLISALLIGQLLVKIRRGGSIYRTIFFLPSLAPPVAATIAFAFLFNPGTGAVNALLGRFGIDGPLWLSDPAYAKPVLLALGVWGMGDVMVIFLAALLDVPNDQYEAAGLDGANAVQQFRYITLPNLSPVLLFTAITGVIQTLQYFTQAAVASSLAAGVATTGGGSASSLGYPDGATLTYPLWLYQMGFKNFYLGYACAMGVILLVISLVFTIFLLRRSAAFLGPDAAR